MALMHSNLAKSVKFDQFLKVDFMIKSMNFFTDCVKITFFDYMLLFLWNPCLLTYKIILEQRLHKQNDIFKC